MRKRVTAKSNKPFYELLLSFLLEIYLPNTSTLWTCRNSLLVQSFAILFAPRLPLWRVSLLFACIISYGTNVQRRTFFLTVHIHLYLIH